MPKNMLISVPSAWVKNVYSLRTDSGINSGNSSFSYTALYVQFSQVLGQLTRYTQVSTMLSAVLSTLTFLFLPPLDRDLYPVSTVPTIKKITENKERNL
jgi:hypothetical protein